MGLFELIFQPLNFLFLIPTIIMLLFLINSFTITNQSIISAFNAVCEGEIEQFLFSGYTVDTKTVFFQFVYPENKVNDNFDLMLEYNDKSFKILDAMQDSAANLKNIVINEKGKKVVRKNFGLLRQCSDETCLCVADTGINNFNFSYLGQYACFSLLYAYKPSMDAFDTYVKTSDSSKSDYEIFNEAVASAVSSLNPTEAQANKIKNCYDYINSAEIKLDSLKYEQFLYKQSVPGSNNEIFTFLNDFYFNTQASLLFDIKECSKIPNEDNCIHTSDIRSNYLILSGDYKFSYEKESISAGKYSACRIFKTASGAICWGNNYHGELGNDLVESINPVLVSGNYNFSSISIGDSHACAIKTDNSVVCWGSNEYGQLGNELTRSNVPVSITKEYDSSTVDGRNYNFSSISAGGKHTCGILTNGSAVCWGNNEYGQLGNGSIGGYSNSLKFVGNNFSIISAGDSHTCGILTNGSAVCWGLGQWGKLGNNNDISSGTPVFVSGNYNFSSISIGTAFSCGILNTSKAMCWGANNQGGAISYPIAVSGNYNFSMINVGAWHACGILTNGSVVCWGENGNGELGNGLSQDSSVPVFVYGDYKFSSISAGASFSCGILTSGTSLCWGNGQSGQLGDGQKQIKKIPVFVKELINEKPFSVFSRNNFNIFIAMNPNLETVGLKANIFKEENLLIISSSNT
ncbi:MAG: hypothetical protein WC376_04475 [Candidatus Nanoarchaeia archaeon]|jgi:alpha-tubulin suppressor-like RCC1 family protein